MLILTRVLMSVASADASRLRLTSNVLFTQRKRLSKLFIAQVRNGLKITEATYATTDIMQTTIRQRNLIAQAKMLWLQNVTKVLPQSPWAHSAARLIKTINKFGVIHKPAEPVKPKVLLWQKQESPPQIKCYLNHPLFFVNYNLTNVFLCDCLKKMELFLMSSLYRNADVGFWWFSVNHCDVSCFQIILEPD